MPASNIDNVQAPFNFNEDETVTFFNTMPSITETELLSRIPGVNKFADNRVPHPEKQVFTMRFQYGYGAGKQVLVMEPGQTRVFPRKLAREIQPHVLQYGVVVIQPGESKEDARLRGLYASLDWHQDNGTNRYIEKIHNLGYSDAEVNRQRLQFKPDLIIMEKEAILQAEIDKLEGTEPVEAVVEEAVVEEPVTEVAPKRKPGRPKKSQTA